MPSTTTAKSSTARTSASRSTKTTKAKTSDKSTKVAADKAAKTVESAAPVVDEEVEDMNARVNEEPLKDSDEIEVVALIPNVSYRDNATADFYEWEQVGDVEYMTVDAITRMRRNHRGYFEDMCLKPNDERVIKKFGLGRFYEKYDAFMDASNYTKERIAKTLDEFSAIRSNSMKLSIVNKIKDMVASGEISDVNVLRTIEKRLDIDLITAL